jgi:hypothetical protein
MKRTFISSHSWSNRTVIQNRNVSPAKADPAGLIVIIFKNQPELTSVSLASDLIK